MDPTALAALAVVGAGTALLVAGLVQRSHRRPLSLEEILGLPPGAVGADVLGDEAEHGAVATGSLRLASRALDRWDRPGSLRERIEQADLALRPAELVVIAIAVALALGASLAVLTGHAELAPVPLVVAPLAVKGLLAARARRRANQVAAQLPDALGLIAGSLDAGHTFLRSIQLLAEELEGPLADELRRVVDETQLGLPLVAALERMAERVCLRDVAWMVRAIRIQQGIGGQLADLLTTLSEHMRAREEVRREIKALTAEGRMSAWVLGAMPVCLFVAVQVVNPGYLAPLLEGWGLLWLGLTAASVGIGIWLILRMVEGVDI